MKGKNYQNYTKKKLHEALMLVIPNATPRARKMHGALMLVIPYATPTAIDIVTGFENWHPN